ncbi:hypothetical protein FB107DRAFT_273035 [Schizophyllum commune]
MVPTPPSIVRKPSSGSRRGRDPPFIVKSSQHCTFEVALPAKTRHDQPGGRAHRDYPRTGARNESSRMPNGQQARDRQDQSRTAPRIARVPPPSLTRVPSTTRPSPPSTAQSYPPSTARSSPPSTARSNTVYGSSTAIYSSPSTARSSPTLVSTPVRTANHANASSPNLSSAGFNSATTWHPIANPNPAASSTAAANAHAYPDDTWSFFTPPTPAVPRFSFNWHGPRGRRGRVRLYGAQVKHYGARYGARVRHLMHGARARHIKGNMATTYGKTKAKGRVWERQIAARAKEASQFVRQMALVVKQEIREMRSPTATAER